MNNLKIKKNVVILTLIALLIGALVVCLPPLKVAKATGEVEFSVETFENAGASVRISDTNGGLRFVSKISKAEYDAAVADLPEGYTATLGTLIIPKKYLTFNSLRIDNEQALNIEIPTPYEEDGYYWLKAVLAKIPASQYGTEILGRSYICIKDDEGEIVKTIYIDALNRNMSYVAYRAYLDSIIPADSPYLTDKSFNSITFDDGGTTCDYIYGYAGQNVTLNDANSEAISEVIVNGGEIEFDYNAATFEMPDSAVSIATSLIDDFSEDMTSHPYAWYTSGGEVSFGNTVTKDSTKTNVLTFTSDNWGINTDANTSGDYYHLYNISLKKSVVQAAKNAGYTSITFSMATEDTPSGGIAKRARYFNYSGSGTVNGAQAYNATTIPHGYLGVTSSADTQWETFTVELSALTNGTIAFASVGNTLYLADVEFTDIVEEDMYVDLASQSDAWQQSHADGGSITYNNTVTKGGITKTAVLTFSSNNLGRNINNGKSGDYYHMYNISLKKSLIQAAKDAGYTSIKFSMATEDTPSGGIAKRARYFNYSGSGTVNGAQAYNATTIPHGYLGVTSSADTQWETFTVALSTLTNGTIAFASVGNTLYLADVYLIGAIDYTKDIVKQFNAWQQSHSEGGTITYNNTVTKGGITKTNVLKFASKNLGVNANNNKNGDYYHMYNISLISSAISGAQDAGYTHITFKMATDDTPSGGIAKRARYYNYSGSGTVNGTSGYLGVTSSADTQWETFTVALSALTNGTIAFASAGDTLYLADVYFIGKELNASTVNYSGNLTTQTSVWNQNDAAGGTIYYDTSVTIGGEEKDGVLTYISKNKGVNVTTEGAGYTKYLYNVSIDSSVISSAKRRGYTQITFTIGTAHDNPANRARYYNYSGTGTVDGYAGGGWLGATANANTTWNTFTVDLSDLTNGTISFASVGDTLYLADVRFQKYVIALSSGADEAVTFAASELKDYIKQSTGVSLQVLTDDKISDIESKKIISVGESRFFETERSDLDFSDLGKDGFYIKTVGDGNIMIDANTGRGILYGVYDLLERNFGVKFVAYDYTYIPTSALEFDDFDVKEVPDFEYRSYVSRHAYSDMEYMSHMRMDNEHIGFTEQYGGAADIDAGAHDSALALVPASDYYSAHGQWYWVVDGKVKDLCYSHYSEYLSIAVDNLYARITDPANADILYFHVCQSDTYDEAEKCTCSDCYSAAASYGRSGMLIRFLNALSAGVKDKLEENGIEREFNLVTLAYHWSQLPPWNSSTNKIMHASCVPADNVYIRLCPVYATGYYNLTSSAQPTNIRKMFTDWQKVTNNLMIWTYNAVINSGDLDGNYFTYYPTLQTYEDNFALFKSMGINYVFMQGAHTEEKAWQDIMNSYIASKMLWDVSLDATDLRDEFLSLYYPGVSSYVSTFIANMDSKYATIFSSGAVYDPYAWCMASVLTDATYFSGSFWNTQITVIKNAIAAVDELDVSTNEKTELKKRLTRVLLTPQYALVTEYDTYYPSATAAQKNAVIKDFFDNCAFAGIKMFAESSGMKELKDKFGYSYEDVVALADLSENLTNEYGMWNTYNYAGAVEFGLTVTKGKDTKTDVIKYVSANVGTWDATASGQGMYGTLFSISIDSSAIEAAKEMGYTNLYFSIAVDETPVGGATANRARYYNYTGRGTVNGNNEYYLGAISDASRSWTYCSVALDDLTNGTIAFASCGNVLYLADVYFGIDFTEDVATQAAAWKQSHVDGGTITYNNTVTKGGVEKSEVLTFKSNNRGQNVDDGKSGDYYHLYNISLKESVILTAISEGYTAITFKIATDATPAAYASTAKRARYYNYKGSGTVAGTVAPTNPDCLGYTTSADTRWETYTVELSQLTKGTVAFASVGDTLYLAEVNFIIQ